MGNIFKRSLLFLLFIFYQAVFAHEQKTVTVMLDWFINPNHAPLFVAQQEGFFVKHGIKVNFITPRDTIEGEKMVAANLVDIALTYQPALTYHAACGLPIIRFATLVDTSLNCLIVLGNGQINSLKDLRGKRIGTSATEIDSVIFSTMLKKVNLDLKDINIINVKFNLISALLTNKIDSFTGGMRNFEPLALEIAGKMPKVFYPEQYGFPQYEELIFITNKNKIHDPSLFKFTCALQEAVSYLRKHPASSWQKFVILHPELNNELNKRSWFISLPYFATHPAKLNKKRYKKLAQFLLEKKLIQNLPKIEEYAVELND